MSETVKLSTLIPDGKNANRGSERGNQMIEDSLRQYGAGRSILIDKHGNIVAGNKTVENAAAIGMDDVIVVQSDGTKLVAVQRTDLDLADPRTRQLAVADNRSSEISLSWDVEALKGLVEDGVDLAPFWTADELAAMWPQTVDLLTDEDDVPPVPVEPVSELGDLYTLGDHRLLCGDSTVLADVERLMGGAKAVCMWTDPPYGVDYTGKTKKALKIENDSSAGLVEMLHEAFACATVALESGAAVYVAHPPGALSVTFGEAFLATGWRLHQTLVWDKGTIVMGHSDYHYSHEPIYFGYTQSTAGRYGRGGKGWYGDNSQKSILSFPKPSRSEEHPTMKPVALIEHCLGNSTQTGTAVLDLFGGSGSTLIACEKTGRRCYMMELSPAYTDVICKRWEQATGKKAVLSAG